MTPLTFGEIEAKRAELACSPFVIVSPLEARKPKVESGMCHLCDGISQSQQLSVTSAVINFAC